ncbi:MAG: S-layer homology domain-containing protein [Bacillota bacterium]
MNKKIKNAAVILLLIFCFTIALPMSAFSYNIKYGYFPDVENNHWAKQVITKMNLRNVTSGYEVNGLRYYKPDQAVGQLEAVIMALRTMGLSSKEDQIDKSRTLSFSVPDWAKGAALVGVDEGLIDDEYFQWNKDATRAWVAQLLVRMIGKEGETNSVSEEILSYSDSYAIPFEYLNYVKVADKYGLIKGSDGNKFNPNQPVTRAQIAAFLSRTEGYLDLKANNVVIGKVTGINGSNITVLGDNGEEYTLVCNISSNLYGNNGEIWVTDLQVNDRVYVIVDSNIVKYLDLNPPQAKTISVTGTVLQVFPGENTIVIKNKNNKIETIALQGVTKIVKDSQPNTVLTIENIVKDQELSISLDSNGRPVKVTIVSGYTGGSGQGIVFHIDKTLRLLTLKNEGGLAAYLYGDNTQISISNNRFASINDIKEGDKLQIEESDGLITKITLVASEVDLSSSGIIKQISSDSRIITYQTSDNQLKAHFVDNNASIDFNGQSGAFADILVGDTIEVKIENGKITSLTVTNRKLHEMTKGVVVSTDYTNRILTIRDSSGQLNAYEIASSAEILVNNDDDAYLHEVKKDMQVEIELTEDKITYLSAKDTILGTIVRVSSSTKVIELTLETGETKSYSLASGFDIDMEDISSPDLDDIAKGDVVEVKIENGKISDIKVQRTITYKVVETYTSSSRVKVIDSGNNSRYLYFYSAVELNISGNDNAKVSDLKVNDIVKATFLGYTLQKVEIAPLLIGTVTSVSSVDNTIALQTFDGRSLNYKFDSSSRVVKNGQTYYHLGVVAVGDRVAVEENLSGGKVYSLMNKVSGKVGAIYKDKTRIYLQVTQTNWQQYDMLTTAYLHQGAVQLTPSDFKLNDLVDIYLANNKVYEVVKK